MRLSSPSFSFYFLFFFILTLGLGLHHKPKSTSKITQAFKPISCHRHLPCSTTTFPCIQETYRDLAISRLSYSWFLCRRVHQLGAAVGTLRLNHAPAAARAPTVDNGALVGCSGDDGLAYSSPYASACLHPDECIHFHRAIGGQHRTFVDLEVWIVF